MKQKRSRVAAARSLLVTAPLLTCLAVGGTAVPAFAASDQITLHPERDVIRTERDVRITADPKLLDSGKLRIRGPGDDSFHVVDDEDWGGGLKYTLDVSCPDYNGPCAGRPAANGTYKISLVSDGLLTRGEDHTKFSLRVPPDRPADVSVTASGRHRVVVRWNAGDEPDLAGYDVLNASGARVRRVSVEAACQGGECSTSLRVPATKAGDQVTYRVKARRHRFPGSGQSIPSSASVPAAAAVPVPATPTSTHSNTPPPSGLGSGNADRLQSPDLSGGSSRVGSTELPSLRPLASASRLALPDVAARSDETFRKRLDYPPLPVLPSPGAQQETGEMSAPEVNGEPGSRAMTSALGRPSQWWKTVALGLVLLLVAAHLGAWSWRTRPAPQVRAGAGRDRGTWKHEAPDGSGEEATAASGRRFYRGRRRAF